MASFLQIALTYTALVAAIVETKRKWRWRYINGAICAVLCIISAVSIIPVSNKKQSNYKSTLGFRYIRRVKNKLRGVEANVTNKESLF